MRVHLLAHSPQIGLGRFGTHPQNLTFGLTEPLELTHQHRSRYPGEEGQYDDETDTNEALHRVGLVGRGEDPRNRKDAKCEGSQERTGDSGKHLARGTPRQHLQSVRKECQSTADRRPK